MNEAHKRFLTNGSNALEADIEEFDVYGKPQFHTMTSAKSERAIIIDFDDAFKEAHQTLSSSHGPLAHSTWLEDALSLPNKALVRIKHNRILRDLFRKESQVHKSVNRYRRDDLITFAKGFTATGVTAFLLIVFGV